MLMCDRWKSKTAGMIALGMVATTGLPLIAAVEAQASLPSSGDANATYLAQSLFDSARLTVPAGTQIQATYDEVGEDGEEVEKIILTPDETVEATLVVEETLYSTMGTVLLPAGSEVTGTFRPLTGETVGTQFYAETLETPDGREFDLDAVSRPVTRTEVITEETDRDFVKGAVIGGAAAAVLSEILGSIDLLEVLGGAGLGALGILIFGGNEEEVEVVVVDPNLDLDLTLQSDLQL
ncbi:MAG: hypothetical protein WBA57_20465 [Elainellaceae cyanobacterium]